VVVAVVDDSYVRYLVASTLPPDGSALLDLLLPLELVMLLPLVLVLLLPRL